jgi:adenylate cyclase
MRKTIVTICLGSLFGIATANECVLQQKTSATSIGSISEIRNIRHDVIAYGAGRKKCTVTLDGLIKNQWVKTVGEYVFEDETAQVGCGIAVEVAKKNLLDRMNSSIIKNESVVICRDDNLAKSVSTKIGSVIESITQLRPHPTFQSTFYHQGQECRWFVEAGWTGRNLQPINGVACKLGPKQWIVVDKF